MTGTNAQQLIPRTWQAIREAFPGLENAPWRQHLADQAKAFASGASNLDILGNNELRYDNDDPLVRINNILHEEVGR